jgi:hypothetical protein
MATNRYSVKGRVVDQSGTGVAVYVEVWDWEQSGPSDDLLIAGSVSKPDGSFEIDISNDIKRLQQPPGAAETRTRKLDRDPDIFLKVFSLTPIGGQGNLLVDRRATAVKNVAAWPLDLGEIKLSALSSGSASSAPVSPSAPSSGPAAPASSTAPSAPSSSPTAPAPSTTPSAPSSSPAAPTSSTAPSAFSLSSTPNTIHGRVVYESSGQVAVVDDADTNSIVTLELNGKEVDKAKIDLNGEFVFSKLAPGLYLVRLPRSVARATANPPLVIDDPTQSEIEVNLEAGDNIDLGDFLYVTQGASVHGVVFLAEKKGDTFDDQPRLTGVRIELIKSSQPAAAIAQKFVSARSHHASGQPDGEPVTHTTYTDLQGEYSFEDIESGNYILRVEASLDAAKVGVGAGALGLASELKLFFVGKRAIERNLAYVATGGFIQGTVYFDKDMNGQRRGGEPTLAKIPVVIVDMDGKPAAPMQFTGSDGSYEFGVSSGTYTLRFRQTLPPDPQRGQYSDELALTSAPEQTISITANEVARAADTGYRLEPHEIVGQVIYEDGAGFEGLVVRLEQNGNVLRTTTTGSDGRFRFEDVRGTFKLRFPEDPFASQLISPEVQEIEVNSIANAGIVVYRRPSDDRGPGGPGTSGRRQDQLLDAVSDIASYMPTSQEVGGPVGRAPSSGGSATADIQQLVDRELMSVLGGRVKLNSDSKPDAGAFVTSLTRAFQAKDVDGHTEYKHIPRAYAVQTELGGAITGAQASFYRRAKVALDDALPLLDGLKPLDPAADDEETAAVRAIVRTEFIELVSEFGREGGPRVQRVDQIFDMLRRHIKDLEERFELKLDKVVTVDEEQNLTNFEVVRDYITSLFATWQETRSRFNISGTDTKYLGTQLVRLSRALNSVAESVEESYRVMDAVLLGPSERQTVSITFPSQNGQQPPMTVDELLSWVARFSMEEAPMLIKEGGRRGVLAIKPLAERLQGLVAAAAHADIKHVAFSRVRVRRALEELASQLEQVAQLANQVADAAPRA